MLAITHLDGLVLSATWFPWLANCSFISFYNSLEILQTDFFFLKKIWIIIINKHLCYYYTIHIAEKTYGNMAPNNTQEKINGEITLIF